MKKHASAKNDACIDPLRLRRLEDHLREVIELLENHNLGEEEKEEKIDQWYLKTKILVGEN
jgi:hypothetical protein